MAIDPAEVLRIARLAHLEYPEDPGGHSVRLLDDDTLQRLASDIDRILEHVRDLQAVDVEGVEPTAFGVPMPYRARPDEAGHEVSPEAVLAGAPARDGDAFQVPKVVE